MPGGPQRRIVAEAPEYGEERLIALELTLVTNTGERIELEMFSCKHTFPTPRMNPTLYGMHLAITAHMTSGDRNGRIEL